MRKLFTYKNCAAVVPKKFLSGKEFVVQMWNAVEQKPEVIVKTSNIIYLSCCLLLAFYCLL